MKALVDPDHALATGLGSIRAQFHVPTVFPAEVVAAARKAAHKRPGGHVDRTAIPFVTLDPAASTDLDQAFAIDRDGGDLILSYAIADVGWFVENGGPIDAEAWRRGASLYFPDGKASLYPPVLGEGAASLLPDGPRPAVLFRVRVAADGEASLDGAERALIHSRAKLAYDRVADSDLPDGFAELAERVEAAELRRGAARVDPPEQEVVAMPGDGFALQFRPRLMSEDRNATLSLAANLAIAKLLFEHRTGLFRVMAPPEPWAVQRLRLTAKAFAIDWPAQESLDEFQRRLAPGNPRDAAMMMAIRRAGRGAAYAPYREGVTPWHSAMAATYAHATAPLRRLADRYVIEAALAIANGRSVPESVTAAFEQLPAVMAKADALDSNIGRAVVDLAEAVMLQGEVGQAFTAIVTDTDQRGARIQLEGQAVVSRIATDGLAPGARIKVRLVEADPARRLIRFQAG